MKQRVRSLTCQRTGATTSGVCFRTCPKTDAFNVLNELINVFTRIRNNPNESSTIIMEESVSLHNNFSIINDDPFKWKDIDLIREGILYNAVMTGCVELVEKMVSEYNYANLMGNIKILHIAIVKNSYDMIEYVIKYIRNINVLYDRNCLHNTNLGIFEDDFTTILDFAKNMNSDQDIIELLILYGARSRTCPRTGSRSR